LTQSKENGKKNYFYGKFSKPKPKKDQSIKDPDVCSATGQKGDVGQVKQEKMQKKKLEFFSLRVKKISLGQI